MTVIHALVADGVFLPSVAFRVFPPLPEAAFRGALRHKTCGRDLAPQAIDGQIVELTVYPDADQRIFVGYCY